MAISFAQIRSVLQVPLLGAVLALTACASMPPPTAELAAAQAAVARAASADADQYASDDLARARQALEQAQAAMANRDQRDARSLALQAAASADLATARSQAAIADTDLAQRRAEITSLKQRLGMEDTP